MGIQINGQTDTVTALGGSLNVGRNLNVPGVLTYDDVTSIDSVGVITARSGLNVTGGNVGVGTDNPGAKLEVHSDAIPRINTVFQGSKHFGMSVGGSGGGFVLTDGHFMTVNHQPYADRGTDNNLTERLRITSDGKFGFNDNNPERTIDVKGSNCMIQLEGTGGNGRQYSLCSSDDITGSAVDGGPSGTFAIYDDTAGAARLRIDSAGNVTLGFAGNSLHFQNGFNNSTARIQNGGGSNSSELKFLVRNAGTESEKMRLTSTAGLAVVTAGSMSANAGNETLYIQGEGHSGHGTSNTRSVVSIIGALTSNNSAAGLWVGTRTNENTAVIGTRTASGNLAVETYNGGAWGERLRITSDGDLFVAGTGGMNTTQLPNGSTINVNGTSSNDGLSVIRYSTGYGAYGLNIGRSKSDTIGTNAAVTNGNDLGHITFYGADGTDFNQAAQITAQVDGTPSNGTDMPGRLVFKTSSDGSATPTERLRITSAGHKWTNNGSIFHGSNDITDFTQASRDTYNNISIRAGNPNAGTTPTNNNSAIKIYPAGTRGSTTGNLTGGIAWQHLDPNNGSWASNYGEGAQIWMGAALHDTPGQERDRFNLWMNSGTTGNSQPGNLAIEAYPNGMVRHPKVPAFMVRNNNNSGAFSGGDIATWNVIILNNGSGFASNKFTAPIDGIYHFSCMMLSQSGQRLFRDFRVNGVQVTGTRSEGHAVSNSYQTNTITMNYSLSANDYVEVYVGPNAGYGGNYTNFNGFLIG